MATVISLTVDVRRPAILLIILISMVDTNTIKSLSNCSQIVIRAAVQEHGVHYDIQ